MKDNQGKPMLEPWPTPGAKPRKVRFFPILEGIAIIGSLEHPLILLALQRLDPAIHWSDLQ